MILLHLGHLYRPLVRDVRTAIPIEATASRQVHAPQPHRPLHPLDAAIVYHVASYDEPIGVWDLVNAVAASQNPASRSESRRIKQEVLARIRPLARAGVLRRVGRSFLSLETRPCRT
jgi:hypothetical protein